MTDQPLYGQRNETPRVACPRHPNLAAISVCKRCDRGTCTDCTVPTEVGTICIDCASVATRRRVSQSRIVSTKQVTPWIIGVTVVVSILAMVSSSVKGYLLYAPFLSTAQPWRLLSVTLVHAGMIHLGLNMLTLYIVGPHVERVMGAWRFLVLYAASAIGGSLAVLAWTLVEPQSLLTATVGASGALFGLFAAVFVLQKQAGADTRAITILLAVNLAYGFLVSGVSWQAHLGGLLVGAAVTWLLSGAHRFRRGQTAQEFNRSSILIAVIVFIVLIALNWALFAAVGHMLGM